MQRKLASYVLLSFLSFSVSTTLFHTVANAQTSELIAKPTQIPAVTPQPTPTLAYVKQITQQPEDVKQKPVLFTLKSTDEPVPTVTAEPQTPTTTPEPTKIIQVTITPSAIPTTEPLPTATPIPQTAVAAPTDLDSLFSKYADEYKVDKEDLKRIAKCEAGFNTNADTGLYAGMYQFAAATWISTRSAMGLDTNPDLRKNAEEAIRTAAYKISNGGRGAWPNC